MGRLEDRIRKMTQEGVRWVRRHPWKRLRSRARSAAVALALLVPVGGLLLSDGERAAGDERSPTPAAAVESPADAAAGDDASASTVNESGEAGESDVGRAWADAAMEREREANAERLAQRFGIGIDLAGEIHSAALEEEIEPEIAFGLVRTESSFRRTVVSWAGAVGYTQLLPSTAQWIAPGTSRSELFDTRTNLRVGFRYLNYLQDKYDGDTRLALLAYNRGPGTVDGILRRGGNPANGYAAKVMSG